jgi:hypothetical protein
MGSLGASPVGNISGVSGLEIFGFELENDNPFENAESDEEFVIKIYGPLSNDLLSSKSRSINLDFQDFHSGPVSPPPKHK